MSLCHLNRPFSAWCILRGDHCYRITFSEDLAKHIISKTGPGYTMSRRKFILTRPLKGGKSRTGLYAIATTKCAYPLRISLIREAAEMMCDEDSRTLWECAPIAAA